LPCRLFVDARDDVRYGKSREVCTAILPFQTLEHIDEPRRNRDDEELGLDTGGRQVTGWTNKLIWGDNKLILSSLKSGALGRLFVEEVVTECRKRGATRVDVLAFESEMGLFPASLEEAKQKGIDLAYIFENEWQSFRTRQSRNLDLTSAQHTHEKPGRYIIAVKVIDIFGNDTMTLVPVSVS
jgi:hypothetical protein